MWKIRKLTTTALFNFPTCQVIMHACKYFLHNVLIYLFSPSQFLVYFIYTDYLKMKTYPVVCPYVMNLRMQDTVNSIVLHPTTFWIFDY